MPAPVPVTVRHDSPYALGDLARAAGTAQFALSQHNQRLAASTAQRAQDQSFIQAEMSRRGRGAAEGQQRAAQRQAFSLQEAGRAAQERAQGAPSRVTGTFRDVAGRTFRGGPANRIFREIERASISNLDKDLLKTAYTEGSADALDISRRITDIRQQQTMEERRGRMEVEEAQKLAKEQQRRIQMSQTVYEGMESLIPEDNRGLIREQVQGGLWEPDELQRFLTGAFKVPTPKQSDLDKNIDEWRTEAHVLNAVKQAGADEWINYVTENFKDVVLDKGRGRDADTRRDNMAAHALKIIESRQRRINVLINNEAERQAQAVGEPTFRNHSEALRTLPPGSVYVVGNGRFRTPTQ